MVDKQVNVRIFVSDFNEKLLQVIDETIIFCLGSTNVNLIYNYLEKIGCPKQEIPEKTRCFRGHIRKISGC